MRILFVMFFLIVTNNIFGQGDYYVYPANASISEYARFYNVDSVLKTNRFSTFNFSYSSVDHNSANFDLEVLGERPKKHLLKALNYTFIKDIGIVLNNDTAKLKLREYVFSDSIEAKNVFKHLDKKIVSGIIVPDYRIFYKINNRIYSISIKSYHRRIRKQFKSIIYPIYNALLSGPNQPYLLFNHDLLKRRNRLITF